MKPEQHDEFWRLYDRDARAPIEAACRVASRRLTSGTMDPADLAAWIDTRIWRMLERDAWPTFHDDPAPEAAVQRIAANARTLARWAYLGLSRAHWRQSQREQARPAALSRAERLAAVSAVGKGLERGEDLRAQLARVRDALSPELKAKIAASWPEKAERRRLAHALGATRPEDTALIEATTNGDIKENTVQQMRSRTRRRLAELFQPAAPLLALAAALALSLSTSTAFASEQSGGRKGGMNAAHSPVAAVCADEQSGGRGG